MRSTELPAYSHWNCYPYLLFHPTPPPPEFDFSFIKHCWMERHPHNDLSFLLNLFLAHSVVYLAVSCTQPILWWTSCWLQPRLLGNLWLYCAASTLGPVENMIRKYFPFCYFRFANTNLFMANVAALTTLHWWDKWAWRVDTGRERRMDVEVRITEGANQWSKDESIMLVLLRAAAVRY